MEYEQPADLVIFYNVIYHCTDPDAAMRKVRELTKQTLCICSGLQPGKGSEWVDLGRVQEHPELEVHPTMYAQPTAQALVDVVKRNGFSSVEVIGLDFDTTLVLRCS